MVAPFVSAGKYARADTDADDPVQGKDHGCAEISDEAGAKTAVLLKDGVETEVMIDEVRAGDV